ncbi:Chloride conductance regulatory protein ICln [Acorus gramineus]|uniref:Chloride conductance regulatory protein ICln n=1 Tax=Acorus gramineus TaxID=55184 RepID=A0AAV9BB83_ACOGR|nr:Chloride conductance regulatory protein ICln [Acorus gramineus]
MALGLRNVGEDERNGDGNPILDADDGEELMHVQPGVSVALGNRAADSSSGTLFISTKRVVWLSDVDRSKGYGVDFVSVSLHAVSRDPEAYSSPCIYCQIDRGDNADEESDGSDSECDGDLDLSKVSEMRLIPSDPNQLDNLFNIFCECAALNPEPGEEAEEENGWIFGDEQMNEATEGEDASEWCFSEDLANPIGHANGGHDLAHSVLELQINDQRFEDAEEMGHEGHDAHQ